MTQLRSAPELERAEGSREMSDVPSMLELDDRVVVDRVV